MPDFFAIFRNICGIVLIFFGLRFYFRRLRLAVYNGGWDDLAARHTMLGEPLGLRW
jgi:hypothetical protein